MIHHHEFLANMEHNFLNSSCLNSTMRNALVEEPSKRLGLSSLEEEEMVSYHEELIKSIHPHETVMKITTLLHRASINNCVYSAIPWFSQCWICMHGNEMFLDMNPICLSQVNATRFLVPCSTKEEYILKWDCVSSNLFFLRLATRYVLALFSSYYKTLSKSCPNSNCFHSLNSSQEKKLVLI